MILKRSSGFESIFLLKLNNRACLSTAAAKARHLATYHSFEIATFFHSFVQDGNSLLHHSSSSTTGMDYQDRPQSCLSSYTSSYEHPQVLSLCYSWKDVSVPCSPVWTLNGPPRVHQNISTSGSAAPYAGNLSSCLSRRLDYPSRFTRTESPPYPTDHPNVSISRIDYQLEEVYARSLKHPILLGSTFQSQESLHLPFRLILRFSHQCPIPSVNIHGHACPQDFIHHQSNLALQPLYPSGSFSSG